MAIVSKSRIVVNGTNFTQVIKCNANGDFSCALPPWVNKALGDPKVPAGDTKDECLTEWSEYVRQYTQSDVVVNRVIVYEFKAQISFAHGMSLSVSATPCLESVTTTNDAEGKKKVKYTYEIERDTTIPHRMFSRPSGNWQGQRIDEQIPWTDENEQFFASMGTGLMGAIEKLEKLGESEAKLLEFIGSGVNLLENKS
jgi:hypothetical protein